MDVELYTTGCPKCKVLEAKLKRSGIDFSKNTDTNEMLKNNFTSVPVLRVNDKFLGFYDANNWINERMTSFNEYRT